MSLNKVMLIARVGKDPEVRYIDSQNAGAAGRKVAQFTAATSERYKDRNGEQHENTEWHSIVVWGKPADFVEGYVKQGALVYLEGKLRSRKYTDKQGVDRYVTEVVADTVQLLSKREETQREEKPAQRPYQSAPGPAPAPDIDEDFDLPF